MRPSSPNEVNDSPKFTPEIVNMAPPLVPTAFGITFVTIGVSLSAAATRSSELATLMLSILMVQEFALAQVNQVGPLSFCAKTLISYRSKPASNGRSHFTASLVIDLIKQSYERPPALE